ncbi:MAG: glycosyltransferase family 4 protein [Saprospiraceae bacterium]
MTIAFDAKRLFQNFTGLGNYSRTLLKNLAKYFPEDDYQLFAPEIKLNSSTQFFIDNPAFSTHSAPHPFHAVWRTWDVKKDIRKSGAQIFHGLSHEIPMGIQDLQVKTVVTMHDLVFKVYPEYTPALQRKLYDFKFRYACLHSDRIIAISEQTKRDIINFYQIDPAKIIVIYQTCGENFQHSEMEVESLQISNLPSEYMLYVGSVIERKNLLRIIEAMDIIPDSVRLPLVVVGQGSTYFKKVKEKIAEKKWKDQVYFIEKMIYSQLPALYRGASIFLYPSEYEGFGIPVIEALFSKIPVITSNVSCLPEAAGPSSLLVNPKSSEEIASAIEKSLADSILRQKMIADGLTYAQENFSSKKVTTQVHQLYQNLLS